MTLLPRLVMGVAFSMDQIVGCPSMWKCMCQQDVCAPSNRVTVLQSFMFAVYTEASQNIQNATGPIDDGYITNVVGALPGDALCCSGPEKLDDGMPQASSAFAPKGHSGLATFCVVHCQ